MIFLPNFTIFAKTLLIRYMEGGKKENYLICKEDVLNSYREYYKDSKEERELPNIYTKNNKSNKFLIQLEKNLHDFLGDGNYPKKQTLGDIFYIKNYVIKEKYEKAFRLYIKQVSRVLKIRELKKEFVKLISSDNDKLEILKQTPNKFSKELESVIRNTIDIEDELTFGNDLNIFFTDKSKHYTIKDSSIEDLRKYVLQIQNDEESKTKEISDVKEQKTNSINAEQVIINTPKVIIKPNKIVQIIRGISPVKKRMFSGLFGLFILWFVLSISSFGKNENKVCCAQKSKIINQYISDIKKENISFFSTNYLNTMCEQLQEKSCGECDSTTELKKLKTSLLNLAVNFNSIEEEQKNIEKESFTQLSKLNIEEQLILYEILLYLCENNICTESEVVSLKAIQNELYELKKEF